MKTHPVMVEGFEGDLRELAKRVCALRYDKLERFFYYCAEECGNQAWADWQRGRKKLSGKLDRAAGMLAFIVAPHFDHIFELCKKHMQNELNASES